ncbi:MAG: hypothetical protein REDVDVYQ_000576, partial [Candidatus Fervidibacter sp.]
MQHLLAVLSGLLVVSFVQPKPQTQPNGARGRRCDFHRRIAPFCNGLTPLFAPKTLPNQNFVRLGNRQFGKSGSRDGKA